VADPAAHSEARPSFRRRGTWGNSTIPSKGGSIVLRRNLRGIRSPLPKSAGPPGSGRISRSTHRRAPVAACPPAVFRGRPSQGEPEPAVPARSGAIRRLLLRLPSVRIAACLLPIPAAPGVTFRRCRPPAGRVTGSIFRACPRNPDIRAGPNSRTRARSARARARIPAAAPSTSGHSRRREAVTRDTPHTSPKAGKEPDPRRRKTGFRRTGISPAGTPTAGDVERGRPRRRAACARST
jgi:hypothetical protein